MATSFGIYIGNTTTCLAINADGKVDVVANDDGDRVTPAIVAFHEGEIVTGLAAKQGMLRHGSSTVKGALRVIGNSPDDDVAPVATQCQVSWDNRHPVFNVLCGESTIRVNPQRVIKNIFGLLKDIASSHCNEECKATISLPAWANDSTISAVKEAANSAGFKVLTTISQPAAACLAYNLLDDNKTYFHALVLHCGNSTSVASIVDIAGGLVTIRDSTSTSSIAGHAITQVLVQHFAKEFFMKYKGDPLENRRSKVKLYNASENCKHILSRMLDAQVHIDSLWEGVDLMTSLSRSRFEGLIGSTLLQILAPMKELVKKSDLDISQISKVVLSGGSCKIPKLQQMIRDAFPSAEILSHMSTDEVLAYGAAIESGLIEGNSNHNRSPTNCLVPALSLPIFCKLTDSKENHCVFTQGTPVHSRQSISLSLDNVCQEYTLVVYEAEQAALDPDEEQILVKVDFPQLPSKAQYQNVDFYLKSDGSLLVNLKDEEMKISKSFSIEADQS